MQIFDRLSQRARIMLVGVVMPAILATTLAVMYYIDTRDRAIQSCIDRGTTLCDMAEATRDHIHQQWNDGIYQPSKLIEYAEQGEDDKLITTVPIVAAMNAIQRGAEAENIDFFVPAFNPRNPDNQPNEFQSQALTELRQSKSESLFKIDPKSNTAHLFRPVFLDESCMICHGDASKAEQIWGHQDGTDITGHPMEGQKPGQMHGAFEIVQSLAPAQNAAHAALAKGSVLVILLLVVSYATSMLVLRSIQQDQSSKSAEIGRAVGNQVADDTAAVASAIEEMSANIRSIAENANHASSNAKDVVALVESTCQQSQALDTSTREIGGVVQLIESIAEQTNLLALNATIEAARAGSVGKGFAVVAGEVKELAQQTATATGAITERIESVQKTAESLLADINNVQQTMSLIDSNQGEIAGAVSQQQSVTEEISVSIQRVLESSRTLADRLGTSA